MASIEEITRMSDAELDTLPEGVIQVDADGKILYFSPSQEQLSRRLKGTTVGLNFFSDVAPCTAVQAFEGRFHDFVHMPVPEVGRSHIDSPFGFDLKFAWGSQRVSITLAKSGFTNPRVYIVVKFAESGAMHGKALDPNTP